MRKRIKATSSAPTAGTTGDFLPIQDIALVEVTSEDPDHPIESVFSGSGTSGWRAAEPGEQAIRIIFDEPQRVQRLILKFVETQRERTQEFVLTCSATEAGPARNVVRQQWTFSPAGSTSETESYEVDLENVGVLELMIRPDLSDTSAVASLAEWRVC